MMVRNLLMNVVSFSFRPFRSQGSFEGALTRSHMDAVKTFLMCSAAHKLQGLFHSFELMWFFMFSNSVVLIMCVCVCVNAGT